jgi:anaerobic magnesium-protoporphyrin IX monomethyl ester cyclase
VGVNVLLINPPYPQRIGSSHVEPIGLAGLSAALAYAGAEVVVVDLAAALPDWPAMAEALPRLIAEALQAAGNVVLVGVGPLVTATLIGSHAIIEAVRASTDARVIVGGPLCVAPGIEDVVGTYLAADAWVAGDGEDPIVALWRAAAAHEWPAAGTVPGTGLPGHAPPIPYRTRDLDRLRVPDRAALGAPTLPSARRGLGRSCTTAAFLSRGCPYACTFCAAPLASGRKVRRFSPERVTLEVTSCRELGYDDIIFYDDCLFVRGAALDQKIAEFTGAITDARWTGSYQLELRCDAVLHMADSSLAALADSGMRQVNMGIEKGHVAALKQLRKRLKPEVARAACERLRSVGVRTAATFILGGRGENASEMAATVEFACSLPLDFAHFNPLAVYPGTQLYDEVFGVGAPWLSLCLDPEWAPRGDILWRGEDLSVYDIVQAIRGAYATFYSDERLASVLTRVPAAERQSVANAYVLLATDRAESLAGPPILAQSQGGALAC